MKVSTAPFQKERRRNAVTCDSQERTRAVMTMKEQRIVISATP